MSPPKIIKSGRVDIYASTRPPAPKADSYISPEVRKALDKHTPEVRARVIAVADRKPREWK
jgi:hypothetical protein